MESTYEISLNMKTGKGIQTYGFFQLGADKDFAQHLYNLLAGSPEVFLDSVITIDLVKREAGIPYPLGLKHCSYDQLSANIKLITKELFKQLNLET
jgi:hypothetical protein